MPKQPPIFAENRYCDYLHVMARQLFAGGRGFILPEQVDTPWLDQTTAAGRQEVLRYLRQQEKFLPLLTGRLMAHFSEDKSTDEQLIREGLGLAWQSYSSPHGHQLGRLIGLYSRVFEQAPGNKGPKLFQQYMAKEKLPFKTIAEYLSTMCLLNRVMGPILGFRSN